MMFVFAVLILTLEQQRAVFPPWFRSNLEQYFLFVTLIAGRGTRPLSARAPRACALCGPLRLPLCGHVLVLLGLITEFFVWRVHGGAALLASAAVLVAAGFFYIYVGMTQAAVNWRSSSFSVLVGLFVIFVGGLYIHTGISVSTKLTQLRESLQSPDAIKHAFMQVLACATQAPL